MVIFPMKKSKVPVKKMRKGVREKTEVSLKIFVKSTLEGVSVSFVPVKKSKVPVKKMRKGVREKTEVAVKILVNSTRETNILARENFYKNVPVKSQKCA